MRLKNRQMPPEIFTVSFISQEDNKLVRIFRRDFPHLREYGANIIYGLPEVIMARWVMDGKLWRRMKTLYTSHVLKCGGLVTEQEVKDGQILS